MRTFQLFGVIFAVAGVAFALGASGAACSSSTGQGRDGSGSPRDGGGVTLDDLSVDRDAFYAQDPPVMYCGLDGGAFTPPPPPGGTLACPDDKNLEGCPCPTVGMTATCWPGLRKNRHLGICMDGTTTCMQVGETMAAWGPCVGAVLPDPNATAGAQACQCFSHGFWKIDNLVPCGAGPTVPQGINTAYSSTSPTMDGGTPTCNTVPAAGSPWTDDTVTADCAGHFTLCYTLKAGSATNPQPTDCTLAKVCSTSDYTMANLEQMWPPLSSWSTSNASCANAFFNTGGYGEMSVSGTTLTCDQLPDHVFQRVSYCAAGQTNCQSGGGGQF